MEDNKKRIIIILLIVFAVFIIAMFAFNSNSSYIILDNKVLGLDNGRIVEKNFSNVKKMYFNVFYDEKYIGKYYAESIYEEDIYFTNNKSGESYNFRSPYIAITSGFQLITLGYEDADERDFDIFKENYDTIVTYEEIDEFKVASIDIDSDGKKEEVYYIIYNDIENKDSFSVTYLIDDGNFILIDEVLYQNNEFGTSRVYYILNRKNTSYIITNTYFMEENEYNIYMYSNTIKKLY